MVKGLQTKYMLYWSLCVPCLKKAKVLEKGLVVKPMIFNDINSRGQVDLIDMQTQASAEYKWIMVYQDNLKASGHDQILFDQVFDQYFAKCSLNVYCE